jgi:hypothetical protein
MRAIHYFIVCLVAVAVVGFAYSGIGAFVRSRADKMGRNKKKKSEEIELCRKKQNS